VTEDDTFDAAARELREARLALRNVMAAEAPMKEIAAAAIRMGKARAKMVAIGRPNYPWEVEP
jgi:hypothetical protein